ncbi:uncharacterized protein VTP21DRAFT_4004 [Calcarisporiella thermophila]|uniref:uncharacterized protein n=1 Tax=Calcarisporiella thermophila TaxID=911321 RepID=UPI0037430EE6
MKSAFFIALCAAASTLSSASPLLMRRDVAPQVSQVASASPSQPAVEQPAQAASPVAAVGQDQNLVAQDTSNSVGNGLQDSLNTFLRAYDQQIKNIKAAYSDGSANDIILAIEKQRDAVKKNIDEQIKMASLNAAGTSSAGTDVNKQAEEPNASQASEPKSINAEGSGSDGADDDEEDVMESEEADDNDGDDGDDDDDEGEANEEGGAESENDEAQKQAPSSAPNVSIKGDNQAGPTVNMPHEGEDDEEPQQDDGAN